MARPDVVWFGESLDANILTQAMDIVSNAEILIVIGTSALVHPAASLPRLAIENQARLIEINPDQTPISSLADEVYREKATSGVQKWWQRFKAST